MSKIPYFFETPVPKYFRENRWFESEHMFKFIHWAFSKCQTVSHKEFLSGREILLQPYEFIASRTTSPIECFLTENVFRNQLNSLVKAGLLKKSTNSLTNHFTCYIWITECFCKNNNQQNNQPPTNHQPTVNHKVRIYKRDKKKLPSSLPSSDCKDREDSHDRFEDSFLNENKEGKKIQVCQGVFLTQTEIDECIQVRGDLETVKCIVEEVLSWKGRKFTITDWSTTIKTWKRKNQIKNRVAENEAAGKKLETLYPDFYPGNGWRCQISRNKLKETYGIVFESVSPYLTPHFIDFTDPDFNENCRKALLERGMNKKSP